MIYCLHISLADLKIGKASEEPYEGALLLYVSSANLSIESLLRNKKKLI